MIPYRESNHILGCQANSTLGVRENLANIPYFMSISKSTLALPI